MSAQGRPSIPREDLIDAMQRLADEIGTVPTKDEMDEQGSYSSRPYLNEFGTWRAALEAAGLDSDTRRKGRIPTACLTAELRRLDDELDHTPFSRDMDRYGEYSAPTYRSRFGSWEAALAEVDLTPDRPGQSKKYDRIIQQLREAEQ